MCDTYTTDLLRTYVLLSVQCIYTYIQGLLKGAPFQWLCHWYQSFPDGPLPGTPPGPGWRPASPQCDRKTKETVNLEFSKNIFLLLSTHERPEHWGRKSRGHTPQCSACAQDDNVKHRATSQTTGFTVTNILPVSPILWQAILTSRWCLHDEMSQMMLKANKILEQGPAERMPSMQSPSWHCV